MQWGDVRSQGRAFKQRGSIRASFLGTDDGGAFQSAEGCCGELAPFRKSMAALHISSAFDFPMSHSPLGQTLLAAFNCSR